tara:strand:- start:110 stop:391 length:282 start_codon:yes stop_codon:yes gene_type:complete
MPRRSGVDLEMVNTILLVVILILVIYCCLRNNNEGFKDDEDKKHNNGGDGSKKNNGGHKHINSGPGPCEIKCVGAHEPGTKDFTTCMDTCHSK